MFGLVQNRSRIGACPCTTPRGVVISVAVVVVVIGTPQLPQFTVSIAITTTIGKVAGKRARPLVLPPYWPNLCPKHRLRRFCQKKTVIPHTILAMAEHLRPCADAFSDGGSRAPAWVNSGVQPAGRGEYGQEKARTDRYRPLLNDFAKIQPVFDSRISIASTVSRCLNRIRPRRLVYAQVIGDQYGADLGTALTAKTG